MGNEALTDYILAVVTLHRDAVAAGGAPVFFVPNQQELDRVSLYLSKITNSMIHDLETGTYVLVKH
ncbi:MAG: capping complex subunit for YIEGIA [Chloroflexota bacterium]